MKLYHHLCEARFIKRPNRFIALCEIDGQETVCHVKNTGRCRELLLPDCRVWLEKSDRVERKTQYDLVAVENRGLVVNMDSQAPNAVFAQWVKQGGFLPDHTALRTEVTYGASRFDFGYERGNRRGFVEVKGVTLFDNHAIAYFPDAPTERGLRHVHELMVAKQAGYEATLCFVLQRDDVDAVMPNDQTHPAFGKALREASACGVSILACACHVTPDSCTITHTARVIL